MELFVEGLRRPDSRGDDDDDASTWSIGWNVNE